MIYVGISVQGFVLYVDMFKKITVFYGIFHCCLILCVIYTELLWLEVIVDVLLNICRELVIIRVLTLNLSKDRFYTKNKKHKGIAFEYYISPF